MVSRIFTGSQGLCGLILAHIWYFTSHPAMKLSITRILKTTSSRGLTSSASFLQSIPDCLTVFMQICCSDDDRDKMENSCAAMKPTQTLRAAKSVSLKPLRAEWAWTDAEVRQSFHAVVAGIKKRTLCSTSHCFASGQKPHESFTVTQI